ncbi:hypothetical protein V9T40_004005 [Parthenolecanium corni]|uniref:Uncharacterized protein n=1 Tax=Parthenolecanium corni TaxID=536013 RepID=A0AAN9Y397_9HEMI
MEIGEKMESQSTKENFKKPKRIIHFGDGEVVEYSTDEDECPESATSKCVLQIDPTSLNWVDWLRFKSNAVGQVALNVCDYLGDNLSSFFGITTPKYQFEIDHYNMMKKLESEISDTEMGSMNNSADKSHENLA